VAQPLSVINAMLVPGAPATAALILTCALGGNTSVSPIPALTVPSSLDAVSSTVTSLDSAT
jgi:hypothetical protein